MNKDLFFDGEKFISARRAAQEVGYADDYVGQLCRDGKLVSKMVGRSWYVSRKSILEHKRNNLKKSSIQNQTSRAATAPESKDLFFNGERFISSSQAAKLVDYANDYVGQLCRSGAVECRMVGRSWYVSRRSILEHKKGAYKNSSAAKAVKSKTPPVLKRVPISYLENTQSRQENVSRQITKITPVKVTPTVPVVYRDATLNAIPVLAKEKALSFRSRFLSGLVVGFITLFIVFSASSAWLSYLSPQASDEVNIGVADAFLGTQGFFGFLVGGVQNKLATIFGTPQNQTEGSQTTVATTPNGLVAIPDNGRHAEDVANVQNDFSDPVNITYDQTGQSGVITPEFRDASTTQGYTFVMVPVKPTTK